VNACALSRPLLLLPYQLWVIVSFSLLMLFWGLACCLASLADPAGNRTHRWLTYWAKSNLALAGLRVEIAGLELLDPRATYIFMPNHASFLDILLAFAYIPYNFRIITKEEIFSIPLMGWALYRSRQIPMDRANPRKGLASLKRAFHLLQEGISIVVFPEGTRSEDGRIKELKATLFILPIRSGVSVVPVRIDGTFAALKRGCILLNPAPLKMTFHRPIAAGSFHVRERSLYAKKVKEALTSAPGPASAASMSR
jgi:1-acyl-sn-glycerol-3-phosphate acyltransferase